MKKLLISTVVSLCLYNVAYAEDNAQVCYDNKNLPCLERLANAGDIWIYGALGHMYLFGDGTTRNYKKAYYWLKKSANQGDVYAQLNLGYMYANGLGTTYDYKKAYIWSLIAQSNSQQLSEEDKKAVEGNVKAFEIQLTKQQITDAQEIAYRINLAIKGKGN